MIIYLDIFFFNNLIIDCFLLSQTVIVTKKKYIWYRIVLSSALGALYSCAATIYFPILQNFLIKIAICVLMNYISCRGTIKELLSRVLLFFLMSFIMAGIILAAAVSTGGNYAFYSQGIYFKIPMFMQILGIITAVMFCTAVLYPSIKRKKLCMLYKNVTIEYNGKKLELTGFADTGNSLVEPMTGLPVSVISPSAVKYFSKDIIKSNRAILVVCNTVHGAEILKGFIPDSFMIDGSVTKAVIAVSKSRLDTDYDIILNKSIIMEENKICL